VKFIDKLTAERDNPFGLFISEGKLVCRSSIWFYQCWSSGLFSLFWDNEQQRVTKLPEQ